MKINVENGTLNIKLNPLEKVLSLHGDISVPLQNVAGASSVRPSWTLAEIRSPGIHIPYIIKGGRYITTAGTDFWYATIGMPFVVIQLAGFKYNRIVLTTGNNVSIADMINGALGK